MNQPYIHFYPRDWLAEYKLRMLSASDRGIWIDLLCLMAMADTYGHLTNMGKPLSDDEVCKILSVDIDTYKGAIKRLSDSGVCGISEDGIVFSRRLVRDYNKRQQASVFGKKGGGNPALKKKKINTNTISISISRESLKGGIKVLNQDFDQFWRAYPRKQGRKKALSSWQSSTKKPEIQVILNSIEEQKRSIQWQKDGGQYIPMPATWINQERWNDQLKIETVPKEAPRSTLT